MVFRRATFDEAVDLFEMYCRAKGLADRTLETYLFALGSLRYFGQDRLEGACIPSCEVLRAFSHRCLRGVWLGTRYVYACDRFVSSTTSWSEKASFK